MVITSCHLIVCSFIYQSIYGSVLNASGVILKENQKVRRNGKVDVSKVFRHSTSMVPITASHGKPFWWKECLAMKYNEL